MRNSKRVSKSKRQNHPTSPKFLAAKMSEVISLRERVAQAELSAGLARSVAPAPPRARKTTPTDIRN